MDPFAPEGVLPNVLRWIGRPGQAVRNVLSGNAAGAGRQLFDFGGDAIDAFLPGDLIPQASRKEDYVSGSELVGLDPTANPWARTGVDIGVELATDPLSFLSFGLTGAAKAAAAAGKPLSKPTYGVHVGVPFMGRTEKAIPGLDAFDAPVDPLSRAMRGTDEGISGLLAKVDRLRLGQSKTVAGVQRAPLSKGYENLKGSIRRAAGAEDLSQGVRDELQAASGFGSQAGQLYAKKAQALLEGLPQDERILLAKAFHSVDLGTLDPALAKAGGAVPLSGNLQTDVLTLANKYNKDPKKLQTIADEISALGRTQWDEGLANTAFANPVSHYKGYAKDITPDEMRKAWKAWKASNSGLSYADFVKSTGAAPVLRNAGRDDYLQRQWIKEQEDLLGQELNKGSTANAQKSVELKTPQQRADYFNKGDVGLELDPSRLLLDRAAQQGNMLKQAQIAKAYGGTGTLADDLKSTALTSIEADVKAGKLTADDGVRLAQVLNGMPARTGVFKSLAGMNKVVKGAMVYGVLIPKVGSLVRNKIGMALQAAATPGVRKEGLKHIDPRTIVNDLSRAFDEAYGEVIHGSKSWARSDELGKDMSLIDEAFKNAKQTKDVGAYLRNAKRDDLADALDHGVLDGFVSTEELVKKIANSKDKQVWLDLYNAPGVMFQTMEQRGRLQTFKDLRTKLGASRVKEAARKTKEAMFDYEISSPANRNFRDIIPFGQFMAKAIPQQAKWLSTKPAVAAAAGPLFYDSSGDNDPIYPYMSGQSRIGVGQDTAGNNLYLTGFGLPMESINSVPNLSGNLAETGRSLSHVVLSSSHPAIKTGVGIVTGRDPFFGTKFGSYDKLPIVGHAGGVGRAVNIAAGTGLLDPLGFGLARQIGNVVDDTKPLEARALDLATGAKLTAVDPDVAERQAISNYLDTRPDVSQYKTFYKQEDDAEFTSLMQALREAKARSKEKKLAAAQAQ